MADQADGRRNRPPLQRGDTMMTARRVAAAKYDLEVIKRDMCRWLSEILQVSITPQDFMETLDTGVVLCQLVELVQQKTRALKEAGGELGLRIPLEPSIKYRPGAKKATFHARENTKHFLDWCRELGIRDDLIFETNGLVEHADEKRVLLCLLEVSRYAREVNIKPPDIISQEEEEGMEDREKRDLEMEPIMPTAEDKAASSDDNTPILSSIGQPNSLNADSRSSEPIASEPMSQVSAEPVLDLPSNSPGDQAVVQFHAREGNRRGYLSLLDYCSYPFLFSFLLLLLLLGGGLYLRKRK